MNAAMIDSLGQRAADLALEGARRRLAVLGRRGLCISVDALQPELRARTKAALFEGLDDAKSALAAGMDAAAEATFGASLMLAGARAVDAALAACEVRA